jgi:hypothetical protein
MALGRPGDDVSLSNHSFKEMDRGLGGSGLIEELDHQRQIDVKSQHVVRMNLAIGAPKPATPRKTVTPFTASLSCNAERISRIKFP